MAAPPAASGCSVIFACQTFTPVRHRRARLTVVNFSPEQGRRFDDLRKGLGFLGDAGAPLEKLSSAGHRDVEELTYYGLAYLRILHEGPDPRYSGC